MVPPTMMTVLADNLPSDKVGKSVGFITGSSWVGVALGVPAIALLGYIGGWRLPFYIAGVFAEMTVAGTVATAVSQAVVQSDESEPKLEDDDDLP